MRRHASYRWPPAKLCSATLTDLIDVFSFARIFLLIDPERELFYFSVSGTTRKKTVRIELGVYLSFIIPNWHQ